MRDIMHDQMREFVSEGISPTITRHELIHKHEGRHCSEAEASRVYCACAEVAGDHKNTSAFNKRGQVLDWPVRHVPKRSNGSCDLRRVVVVLLDSKRRKTP